MRKLAAVFERTTSIASSWVRTVIFFFPLLHLLNSLNFFGRIFRIKPDLEVNKGYVEQTRLSEKIILINYLRYLFTVYITYKQTSEFK